MMGFTGAIAHQKERGKTHKKRALRVPNSKVLGHHHSEGKNGGLKTKAFRDQEKQSKESVGGKGTKIKRRKSRIRSGKQKPTQKTYEKLEKKIGEAVPRVASGYSSGRRTLRGLSRTVE